MQTRTQTPHDRFMQMAMRAPRLDRASEEQLMRRFKDKADRRAADKLVRSHLRSVVYMALKYKGYGVDVGELIAAGNVGLSHALNKFDPSMGNRFGTYADHWIRATMVRHMIRSRSMVTGGYGALESRLFFKLRRESTRMRLLYGDADKALEALSENLELPKEQVELMLRRVNERDTSLDAPRAEDTSSTRLDYLTDEAPPQDELAACAEGAHRMREALDGALEQLDEREQVIVNRRLLAEPDERETLEALGEELGLSRERVRQLEVALKEKLSRRLARDWKTRLKELLTPGPMPHH